MKKKREQDRVVQSDGFRPPRDRNHKLAVQRLQQLIRWRAYPHPHPLIDNGGETELFTSRVVADAIGGSIKVIQSLARRQLLEAAKTPRKLFFSGGAVIKYLRACDGLHSLDHYHACFRSEKIATDDRFVCGMLIPKAYVADRVGLSIRAVERAINSGELKAAKIGKMTLVEQNSFFEFSFKRQHEAYRKSVLARERLEVANKVYQKLGPSSFPDGVTKDGAARELGVSKRGIERLIKSGALNTFRPRYSKMTYIFRKELKDLQEKSILCPNCGRAVILCPNCDRASAVRLIDGEIIVEPHGRGRWSCRSSGRENSSSAKEN